MNYRMRIKKHLENSGGIVTNKYCRENNIPTVYLSRMHKKGELLKVKKGIYITPDGDYDEYYFFQHQYKKAIFSYETALYILDITDKIPWSIDVTVYNGYKFNKRPKNVNIHYTNKSIYNLGIIEKETMFGNKVKLYSYEKTICDFILNKDKMDIEVYIKLIRSYASHKEKDIHSLYDISKRMGIEDKVREVMEMIYE